MTTYVQLNDNICAKLEYEYPNGCDWDLVSKVVNRELTVDALKFEDRHVAPIVKNVTFLCESYEKKALKLTRSELDEVFKLIESLPYSWLTAKQQMEATKDGIYQY